jgi:integrase/recombinase XerD
VRFYTAYMFEEYGDCDSYYVFVNLFAEPYGAPLLYKAVRKLVYRLRAAGSTSRCICCATPGPPVNSGVPQHVIQRLLCHASPQTTNFYAHLHDTTIRAGSPATSALPAPRQSPPGHGTSWICPRRHGPDKLANRVPRSLPTMNVYSRGMEM